MDVDKACQALSGWSLEVLQEIKGRGTPREIIALCKKINTEGRKLEYRGRGIKYYEKLVTEADTLVKAVERHLAEYAKAREEFKRKNGRDLYWSENLGYDECSGVSKYKDSLYVNAPLGKQDLIKAYSNFISPNFFKPVVESIKKAITEERAASLLIVGLMERVAKLKKADKDPTKLKARTEALYVQAEKYASSMYNVSRVKPISEFESKNSHYGKLTVSEVFDVIRDHLKKCKKP